MIDMAALANCDAEATISALDAMTKRKKVKGIIEPLNDPLSHLHAA